MVKDGNVESSFFVMPRHYEDGNMPSHGPPPGFKNPEIINKAYRSKNTEIMAMWGVGFPHNKMGKL